MSPRHFSDASKLPTNIHQDKDLGPTLWFAFTSVTGIAKLFTYTPDTMSNNHVKDLAKGQGKDKAI